MKIWNNFLCWHHVKTPPIKILTGCQHDICIMKIINSETIPTNTDPLVYQRTLEEVATTWTMKNQNDGRNWNGYDVTTICNQHWQIHFLLTDGWWCGWWPKILLWCYDDDHFVNDFINQRQREIRNSLQSEEQFHNCAAVNTQIVFSNYWICTNIFSSLFIGQLEESGMIHITIIHGPSLDIRTKFRQWPRSHRSSQLIWEPIVSIHESCYS